MRAQQQVEHHAQQRKGQDEDDPGHLVGGVGTLAVEEEHEKDGGHVDQGGDDRRPGGEPLGHQVDADHLDGKGDDADEGLADVVLHSGLLLRTR